MKKYIVKLYTIFIDYYKKKENKVIAFNAAKLLLLLNQRDKIKITNGEIKLI